MGLIPSPAAEQALEMPGAQTDLGSKSLKIGLIEEVLVEIGNCLFDPCVIAGLLFWSWPVSV